MKLFRKRKRYIWCPWLDKVFVVKHEEGNKEDTALSDFYERMRKDNHPKDWHTHKTFYSLRSLEKFLISARINPDFEYVN